MSIFLSVDPHADRCPNYTPYVYTFNNPINYIDPDGRDGVRVIDRENRTITIKANYYLQTENRTTRTGTVSGYSQKDITRIETRTNEWLNKQNLSVSEGEYEGYNIVFDLSFKEGGSASESRITAHGDMYEGHNIGNSIERGNQRTDPTIFSIEMNDDGTFSHAGGATSNKTNIIMNTTSDNRTNQIHEFGHTLGLDDNVKTGEKGGLMAYPPGKISQKEANKLGNGSFLPAVEKNRE
ncbi:hypothetical protein [Myroides sp. WP-1]|uniref:hypothetical protein n=1 Tax=Myroides sp. WP-1 TaxID=2759944 RepID=UPI0015FCD20C|nr:hypothetical protein [Myroides sp. WP-1]